MPELPEVETVRKGLVKALSGRSLAHVDLRRGGLRAPFPEGFADNLTGRRVLDLRRRAKYILIDLEGGDVWLVHLGMSGSFRLIAAGAVFTPAAHDHVIVTLDTGARLVYTDPRRFGQMDVFARAAEGSHPAISKLGPEPLAGDFDGTMLAARLKGRTGPIKTALLDQSVVAGVGNIYACEALYRAGISPKRRAGSISGARAQRLAQAIRQVMLEALESGGSTLRDHKQINGDTGYFQHHFDVYDHAGAACGGCDCGGKSCVRAIRQGGRTTFYCPTRQR